MRGWGGEGGEEGEGDKEGEGGEEGEEGNVDGEAENEITPLCPWSPITSSPHHPISPLPYLLTPDF